MELQFKFLAFIIFLLTVCCASSGAQAPPQTEQNSEALEMVAQRMRSLTHSLEGMPQPPALDQTIQIPDGSFLNSKNSQDKGE